METTTPEFFLFLGRFHPLALHLPIGFMALGLLLEIYARGERHPSLRAALPFIWLLSAIGAVLAAGLGYLLSLEGGYQEEMLSDHKWLGIGLAAISILIYFASRQRAAGSKSAIWQKGYVPMLVLMGVLLGGTGHIGGSLTHGSEYLTQYAPQGIRSLAGLPPKKVAMQLAVADLPKARVFHDLVQPILEARCVSCHNPEKKKGELLLTDAAGIKAGGEEGKIIQVGNADASSMYQRLLLPHDDEEHMPPPGKRPLNDDQIDLIAWWIDEGAPMEASVLLGDNENAAQIMPMVQRLYAQQAEGVFALEVEMADEDDIQKLRAQGIQIHQIVQEQPWLEANLSDRDSLPLAQLEALLAIKDQLIELDLGNAEISDEHLKSVGQLTHLTRLHLEETPITDAGLSHLQKLTYLEYLNLFGTTISDAGLEAIRSLKGLKSLYLWQTEVSQDAVGELLAMAPQLRVELGLDPLTIFGSANLSPPQIIADKKLFRDSNLVELKMDIKGIEIRYTLDGSEPDSTSPLYEKPFLLTESATLKTFASKEGWLPSPVLSEDFVKVAGHSPDISLAYQPSEKYQAQGELSLVDLQKGTQQFRDGNWLGFEAKDLVATLDLQKSSKLRRVSVSCLEDVGAWIFYPIGLEISVSEDGKTYKKIASKDFPKTKETTSPSMKHFNVSFDAVEARYVKVETRNFAKIPSWHPGAGGKAWLFVDEVMVE
ncbi:MAG: FN3 associated domain-containing protein [Bacteroidota bacterium]